MSNDTFLNQIAKMILANNVTLVDSIEKMVDKKIRASEERLENKLTDMGNELTSLEERLTKKIDSSQMELEERLTKKIDASLMELEERLTKKIDSSQMETVDTLSEMIHTGYNLHEVRIQRLEKTLNIAQN
jgi:hypothetical protein